MAIGPFRGGPLFFAHYSFLGFDPRGKKDAYTNYFIHNRRHSLINQAYCIANPESHSGYSAQSWGLTASDDPLVGYLAHEPTAANDNGTLAPTAALSSMPYVQGEAMAALRHFYRDRGARLWGPMGFYDAFNPGLDWYADSYLAIDQGPIICMIENARTGLLWDRFMSNPEIGPALTAVGFVNDTTTVGLSPEAFSAAALHVYPEPDAARCQIGVQLAAAGPLRLEVYDLQGRRLATLSENQTLPAGTHTFIWECRVQARGVYVVRLEAAGSILSQKIAL
ncbi:MAG: T9SS C-terminal target domain-containing protein [Bacteroidetes bacterium]|nr:MAG: T9SS C-terminal target domain-containing protein [Bacteroidota bacterium]